MSALTTAPHDDDPCPDPTGLTDSAAAYRRWGWLIRRVGARLLLITDSTISAVEMPASIAAEVQHYLSVRLLAGPVIVLPGAPTRWLLLTASADNAAPVNLLRLRARRAWTHRRGALVALPPSRLECGAVSWRVPPSLDGPRLPPFTAVVAAVRAMSETAGLS